MKRQASIFNGSSLFDGSSTGALHRETFLFESGSYRESLFSQRDLFSLKAERDFHNDDYDDLMFNN